MAIKFMYVEPIKGRTKLSIAQRSAAFDTETMVVYIPPEIAPVQPMVAVMMASWDGVPMVTEEYRGNTYYYLPVPWLCAEFPDLKDDFVKIENKIKTHFGIPL